MVKHDPGILWRSVRTCDMRWTPNYSWDRRSAIVGERVNRNTSRKRRRRLVISDAIWRTRYASRHHGRHRHVWPSKLLASIASSVCVRVCVCVSSSMIFSDWQSIWLVYAGVLYIDEMSTQITVGWSKTAIFGVLVALFPEPSGEKASIISLLHDNMLSLIDFPLASK